jgi:hypothetical protein
VADNAFVTLLATLGAGVAIITGISTEEWYFAIPLILIATYIIKWYGQYMYRSGQQTGNKNNQ